MSLNEPSACHASPGNFSATLLWAPPASGDAPTGYHIELFDDGGLLSSYDVSNTEFSLHVGALTTGTHYHFQVAATIGGTSSAALASNTVTPTAVAPPDAPTHVRVTAGNKAAAVTWSRPGHNNGANINGYIVRVHTESDDLIVQEVTVDPKHFAVALTKLTNDVIYYVRVRARNSAGIGDFVQSDNFEPVVGLPAVFVSFTQIGPDKTPNTRPGESPQDGPRLTVKGTNVDQAWGADAEHALEWVLYTSSSHATIVGVDTVTLDVEDVSSTSFTISAPVAPGGSSADSNHLIGPWRLKGTYVPDAAAPTTVQVAYSPDFYTTQVGSIVIGTVSPDPLTDGDTVTITGPDVGVCTVAEVTVGGLSIAVTLTRVDQNTVTLVFPTFGFQLDAGGDITLQYELNGHILTTPAFDVDWSAAGAGGPPDGSYVPPAVLDIPAGDTPYPTGPMRWVFLCPSTGETYTVARNPDAMTSPFAARTIVSKQTTALDGKMVITEGAPVPSTWQFSGTIADARHYEFLRHWVNDVNQRVQITDHYGRVIDCVLMQFNPVPKRDIHRLWAHTYTVTALVIDVSEPTVVPA